MAKTNEPDPNELLECLLGHHQPQPGNPDLNFARGERRRRYEFDDMAVWDARYWIRADCSDSERSAALGLLRESGQV